MVVAAVLHGIVHPLDNGIVNVSKGLCCGLSAHIGRGGHDGLAVALAQAVTEFVVGNSDAYAVFLAQNIVSQVIGTLIVKRIWF